MSSSMKMRIALVISIAIAVAVVTAGAAVAQTNWPKKKAELCWVAEAGTELSFVRAMVTHMGKRHYVFHGYGFRLPDGDLQPFDGSAERRPDSVVGMITKMELNGEWLESYSGLMVFDLTTLDGAIDGVITKCITPPTTPLTCEVLNTGPIALWYDDDCDPSTLPPEIMP